MCCTTLDWTGSSKRKTEPSLREGVKERVREEGEGG